MEEKIEISILLSLYGNLLTETQKKYMELYYNEDFSLSEIGDNENITRQAVRTILVKSKKKLEEYEETIKSLLDKLKYTNLSSEQENIIKKINDEFDF